MAQKRVLVTGIGGNVGQGVVRVIRRYFTDIFIVGINVTEFSAGNHLVDEFEKVSYGDTAEYIDEIVEIVKNKKIDLIIPTTDSEVNSLAINRPLIKCKVAGNGAQATSIYYDKWESYQWHKKNNIAFAKSYLPSKYNKQCLEIIAKPRKGRGSRELFYNPTRLDKFEDKEFVIQELHTGVEITSAFYYSYKTGKRLGAITMKRELDNGATVQCEVLKEYDKKLNSISDKIVEKLGLKGSFNIQSIVTAKGEIVPFEVNCRISGTNSIRGFFGFEDVVYTINELLYNKEMERMNITHGVAFRYLSDVIYVGKDLEDLKGNNKDQSILF